MLTSVLLAKLSVRIGAYCVDVGLLDCEVYWEVTFYHSLPLASNKSHPYCMQKALMSQRAQSLINLWHQTQTWSTEASRHLNQIQVEVICSEKVLATQRSVRLNEKLSSFLLPAPFTPTHQDMTWWITSQSHSKMGENKKLIAVPGPWLRTTISSLIRT